MDPGNLPHVAFPTSSLLTGQLPCTLLSSPYLLLLGGVRAPLFLLVPTFPALVSPLLLRTCLSIQARKLVRLLCSDSTIRGHGLHSAMSRAAMAIARPTCVGEFASVSLSSSLAAVCQQCGTQHKRRQEARSNSGYSESCALVLYLLFRAGAGVHGTMTFPEEFVLFTRL